MREIQFLAIPNSVRLGVVALDQEAHGAQLVAFEHRFPDRFGHANQGRRVFFR
jgi:hypothetical protein